MLIQIKKKNNPITNTNKIVFKIKFCYKLDSVTVDSIYRVENLKIIYHSY